MPKYSDAEILSMLRSVNREDRSQAFRFLYDNIYAYVAAFVLKNGGNASDAEDLFQDSLIAFYEKSLTPGFQIASSISNYIHGISKNLWFKRFKKKKKELSVEDVGVFNRLDHSDEINQNEEQLEKLNAVFLELSEGCQKILKLFYFEKKSMKEIAEAMQLANEGVAKNKKARCLQKMKSLFQAAKKNKQDRTL